MFSTGCSVDFNGILPKKYKEYDFITNIIKMFNLYIEPSKEVQNCLIIEPRIIIILSDIVDWRLKVDNSKEITETIVGETQKKYTTFTYKWMLIGIIMIIFKKQIISLVNMTLYLLTNLVITHLK